MKYYDHKNIRALYECRDLVLVVLPAGISWGCGSIGWINVSQEHFKTDSRDYNFSEDELYEVHMNIIKILNGEYGPTNMFMGAFLKALIEYKELHISTEMQLLCKLHTL